MSCLTCKTRRRPLKNARQEVLSDFSAPKVLENFESEFSRKSPFRPGLLATLIFIIIIITWKIPYV
jgi:hypothetical protein